MIAAHAPRSFAETRVLDLGHGIHPVTALPEMFEPGDVIVVNDASTLPASIQARTATGAAIEIRLASTTPEPDLFVAAILGEGDYHTRTEDRPRPPRLALGEVLVANGIRARVEAFSPISPNLVALRFEGPDPVDQIFRAGKPVQYAHVSDPLALWDVTNAWASRPWAVEMPSAGRGLSIGTLLALRARGVKVVTLTHGAGLSATGDVAIDAALPIPERYDVPASTLAAIRGARRVIAVGTSVVRALESVALRGFVAGEGVTDLRIGPDTKRNVVDAILTGTHEIETSHFELLQAFATRPDLERAIAESEAAGLLGHELGDLWLIWGEPVDAAARGHEARSEAPSARFAA